MSKTPRTDEIYRNAVDLGWGSVVEAANKPSDPWALCRELESINKELVEALNNLCWECDAITETRAPSRKAYNEAQAALAKAKEGM